MKFSAVALLASVASVASADRLLSCGHQLVNDPRSRWTQADIAKAVCGRTDTCDGKEWNTLIETVLKSSGPASWSELKSTGVFCTKGCYGDVGKYNGQCH